MKVLFTNAQIILENEILKNSNLITEDNKIAYIGSSIPVDNYHKTINVDNNYLSPGLIDTHIHGGNNYDFMDASENAFNEIANFHSKHGITSILATSQSAKEEDIFNFLYAYDKYANNVKSCNYLGVHLEGPYFSMEFKGAQDPEYIVNPQKEQYEKYINFGTIKRISVAPELDGALELGKYLKERGIIASIAHSAATFDIVEEAVKSGYNLITHFYCGMSTIKRINSYRFAGVIEAGYYFDELTCEIIADNRHVPKDLLKLTYKIKGKDKIILTSDAIRGAGLSNGETSITGNYENGREIIIEDDVAKMPDRTSFAGSVASGDRLIRTMTQVADIPLVEAISMMTVNPAKLLNIYHKKGSISLGKDADLIIFDENINIISTFVNGQLV